MSIRSVVQLQKTSDKHSNRLWLINFLFTTFKENYKLEIHTHKTPSVLDD